MRIRTAPFLVLVSAIVISLCGWPARAQVVADGTTNTLSNVTTNINGDVIVGTNGSFTLLILSTNAALTNSGNGLIGRNAAAKTNEVRLISPTAQWRMGGSLFVGSNGAMSRLVVSDGALVENFDAVLANGTASSNNLALITGNGSIWSNRGDMTVGFFGRENQLMVSNGARLINRWGYIGRQAGSSNNVARVVGSGSFWSNQFDLFVGANERSNRLVIEAGGMVVCANGWFGNSSSAGSSEALISGPGSIWSNRVFLTVGDIAGRNRLVVSNGGSLKTANAIVGSFGTGPSNQVIVTGTGSTWTNQSLLTVGATSTGNRVEVSDGGRLVSNQSFIGENAFGNNNTVLLTGAGSAWNNLVSLSVGHGGGGNVLIASNGGLVSANNLVVGFNSTSDTNRLMVDGGMVRVTNGSANALLDVRRGLGSLNAGLIEADRLMVTNVLGSFEVNGGTLVTRGAIISNQLLLAVGSTTNPATWDVRAGGSHILNAPLFLGFVSPFNRLLITNGALLSSGSYAYIGGNNGSSNTVLITGPGSGWVLQSELNVGYGGQFNRLIVSNTALVEGSTCIVGGAASGTNNEALITGPASSLSLLGGLQIGSSGSSNRVRVENGGLVSGNYLVGLTPVSAGNQLSVTGPGSNLETLSKLDDQIIGQEGPASRLTISNGATVRGFQVILGVQVAGSNNLALATGTGTLWSNRADMYIGFNSSRNQLVVNDGAKVFSSRGVLGENDFSSNNVATINGAGSLWSNSLHTYVGANGWGNELVVSNGGLVATALDAPVSVGMSSRSNNVTLTGAGSRWTVGRTLQFGYGGIFSQLAIDNGATLLSSNAQIGVLSTTEHIDALVSGPGSTWTNLANLEVGMAGSANRLMVSNGACVVSGSGNIGTLAMASANAAIISGSNSRWLLQGDLYTGSNGPANTLLVTDGALVSSADGILGFSPNSVANLALLSGTGTVCIGRETIAVGFSGNGNRLEIRDGARAESEFGILGFSSTSSNNQALVTGPGSLWTNSGAFSAGLAGRGNRLIITNGGEVISSSIIVGEQTSSTNNRIVVDGGVLRQLGSPGSLDIRRGTNVLNAGLVDVRELRLTNALGFFELNGGTLTTRGAAISNGTPFFIGNQGAVPATWDVRAGGGPHTVESYVSVGENTSFNRLLVTNGATLMSLDGVIGSSSGAKSNSAVIAGPGSRWMSPGDFSLGLFGSGNSLVISNGGSVSSGFSDVGALSESSNNVAIVTGAGSVWSNQIALIVGRSGAGNRLSISDTGTVHVLADLLLGSFPTTSSNNLLHVNNGTLRVQSPGASATLDIRSGTNRLDAGLIQTDRLRLTNAAGRFEFNGGTLSVGNSTVNHGQLFRVGNGTSSATLTLSSNGTHLFANGLTLSSNASLAGNGNLSGFVFVQPGGRIAPGVSVGKIVLSDSPLLQGVMAMEISKTGATLTNDHLQVSGPLTYSGALVVTNLGPTALTAGDRFQLFSASSFAGTFSSLSLPPLPPGLSWVNKLLLDGSIEIGTATAPAFAAISLVGTNILLVGTNGTPGANYVILTATNVALPLSNWLSLTTNQFDGSGGFRFTNAITAGVPQRFFRIRIP